jgi:hypothetical protein
MGQLSVTERESAIGTTSVTYARDNNESDYARVTVNELPRLCPVSDMHGEHQHITYSMHRFHTSTIQK